MKESEELLELIDAHIEAFQTSEENLWGMKSIRFLVYNFFNAPRPMQEPRPLTEEELKDYVPDPDFSL